MQLSDTIGCTVQFTPPGAIATASVDSTDSGSPEREPLRVLLIGSRRGVTSTIQTLYRLGFAEVGEWSPLLPAPTPGEVMSILTRYLLPG